MSKTERDRDRKADRLSWLVAPASADETWFRHHNWEARRTLVRQALVLSHSNEFVLNRYDECGGECLIEFSESEQRYRLRANYCRCRHCGPCGKAKASLLSKNLMRRLDDGPKHGDRFRFITLTLRHSPKEELRPLIDRLYRCFRALRQEECWKTTQHGGALILEVKWSKTGGWHPHLHVVADGYFLKAEKLRAAWHRITKDSFKADIRDLPDVKAVCYYVSKYVGKSVNDEVWQHPQAAAEFVLSMKGVRFCATYGKWRGFALLKADKANDASDWQPVALLNQIAERARSGEMVAITMLLALEEALVYDPHRKRKPEIVDPDDS